MDVDDFGKLKLFIVWLHWAATTTTTTRPIDPTTPEQSKPGRGIPNCSSGCPKTIATDLIKVLHSGNSSKGSGWPFSFDSRPTKTTEDRG